MVAELKETEGGRVSSRRKSRRRKSRRRKNECRSSGQRRRFGSGGKGDKEGMRGMCCVDQVAAAAASQDVDVRVEYSTVQCNTLLLHHDCPYRTSTRTCTRGAAQQQESAATKPADTVTVLYWTRIGVRVPVS